MSPGNVTPARVGLFGAGDISGRYVEAMRETGLLAPVAIASATGRTAAERAQAFGLRNLSVEQMLADEHIDLVINLTPPLAHGPLNRAALLAGKHVYSEKPLAGSFTQASELVEIAEERGLLLASAPATFLGPALQTARSMVDSGEFGEIVGARATMVYPGPDLWHHNPDHLFGALAGPLFDMGVYHLGALVALLGPVRSVQALGYRRSDERAIIAGPRAGERFPVSIPTHIVANLELVGGALASAMFSFDGFGSKAPGLELIGTNGAIAIAQPSTFDGKAEISRTLFEWTELPTGADAWTPAMWVIGPVEAWVAQCRGVSPRANATFACHLIELLSAIETASVTGEQVAVRSRPARPTPLSDADRGQLWTAAAG